MSHRASLVEERTQKYPAPLLRSVSAPLERHENVLVMVRMRPLSDKEVKAIDMLAWNVQPNINQIHISTDYQEISKKKAEFMFDRVVMGSDNYDMYDQQVSSLVRSVIDGLNGTVFAYGQTSSGKTYTMSGTDNQPGIIPRAIDDIFTYIQETKGEREFLLRASYLEIYNETIRDLLVSDPGLEPRIHESKARGVYVSPLKEEIVVNPEQVMKVLQKGESNRHTSKTDYNEHSSRSHTVFQLVIESRDCHISSTSSSPSPLGLKRNLSLSRLSTTSSTVKNRHNQNNVRWSVLNLIDLAGSEKAQSSSDRRKEGSYINRSLLTLGTVIAKLTDLTSSSLSHIPYRDSKLTRLLQPSLSGNAKVIVICTITPAATNYEESHNTLKFAARVKKVVTNAQTNELMDDKTLLQQYRKEIEQLKEQLTLSTMMMAQTTGEQRNSEEATGSTKYEEQLREQIEVNEGLKKKIEELSAKIIVGRQQKEPQSADSTTRRLDLPDNAINRRAKSVADIEPESIFVNFQKIENLNELESVIQKLQSEIVVKDREIGNLKKTMDNMVSSRKKMENELRMKEQEIQELQILSAKVSQSNSSDNHQNQEKYRLEFEHQRKLLEERNQNLEEEKESYLKRLRLKDEEIERLSQNKVDTSVRDRTNSIDELIDLRSKDNISSTDDIRTLELQHQLDQFKDQIGELVEERQGYEEKIDQLYKQLDQNKKIELNEFENIESIAQRISLTDTNQERVQSSPAPLTLDALTIELKQHHAEEIAKKGLKIRSLENSVDQLKSELDFEKKKSMRFGQLRQRQSVVNIPFLDQNKPGLQRLDLTVMPSCNSAPPSATQTPFPHTLPLPTSDMIYESISTTSAHSDTLPTASSSKATSQVEAASPSNSNGQTIPEVREEPHSVSFGQNSQTSQEDFESSSLHRSSIASQDSVRALAQMLKEVEDAL